MLVGERYQHLQYNSEVVGATTYDVMVPWEKLACMGCFLDKTWHLHHPKTCGTYDKFELQKNMIPLETDPMTSGSEVVLITTELSRKFTLSTALKFSWKFCRKQTQFFRPKPATP